MSLPSTLRRFNRTFTQRVGVLDESYLGTGRPLNVSRLLFEIGAAGPVTLRELRDRLGLDSGYLTRMLARLESDGLVRIRPDATDRRRRLVEPTDAGRTAFAEQEERSERLAAELVAPLTPRQEQRLADALATADLLLRAATVRFEEVEEGSLLAQAALRRYFDELGARFPGGFDPGPSAPAAPAARYVVVRSDGEPVAYGGVRPLDDAVAGRTAEIKRMWVDPSWRGAGLGGRMLRHLEGIAREGGYFRIRLDTNESLAEAVTMYEHAGYARIDRYNDNPHAQLFFEKLL